MSCRVSLSQDTVILYSDTCWLGFTPFPSCHCSICYKPVLLYTKHKILCYSMIIWPAGLFNSQSQADLIRLIKKEGYCISQSIHMFYCTKEHRMHSANCCCFSSWDSFKILFLATNERSKRTHSWITFTVYVSNYQTIWKFDGIAHL